MSLYILMRLLESAAGANLVVIANSLRLLRIRDRRTKEETCAAVMPARVFVYFAIKRSSRSFSR